METPIFETYFMVSYENYSYFLGNFNKNLYKINHLDNTLDFIANPPMDRVGLMCILFVEAEYICVYMETDGLGEIWKFEFIEKKWSRLISKKDLKGVKGVGYGWRKGDKLWMFSPLNSGLVLVDLNTFQLSQIFEEARFSKAPYWNIGTWDENDFYYVYQLSSCVHKFNSETTSLTSFKLKTLTEEIDDKLGIIEIDYSKKFFWICGFKRFIYKYYKDNKNTERIVIPKVVSYPEKNANFSVFIRCVSLQNATWFFTIYGNSIWYIKNNESELKPLNIDIEYTNSLDRIELYIIYVKNERYIGVLLVKYGIVIEIDDKNITYKIMRYKYGDNLIKTYLGKIYNENTSQDLNILLNVLTNDNNATLFKNYVSAPSIGADIYRHIL